MRQILNYSIIKKLPRNHFKDVTDKVLSYILNGRCCSVTGIPGYGMEFFTKHIAYIIETEHSPVSVAIFNIEFEKDLIKAIENYLLKASKSKDLQDIKLKEFLESNKLVLILSEVYSPLERNVIKFLDSIRWLAKDNLTFLTVSNYSILRDLKDFNKYSSDILFPILKIPNFDLQGVKKMIEINNDEYNWNIPDNLVFKIHKLSGGSPALVKYICMALYEEGLDILEYQEKLVETQPLNKRLSDIAEMFLELPIDSLVHIGAINKNGEIFSEIIAKYLNLRNVNYLKEAYPDLTKRERQILFILKANPEKMINKEQMAVLLGQSFDTYSEWAIYKAINRLKSKLKNETIETIKGQGWKLGRGART